MKSSSHPFQPTHGVEVSQLDVVEACVRLYAPHGNIIFELVESPEETQL